VDQTSLNKVNAVPEHALEESFHTLGQNFAKWSQEEDAYGKESSPKKPRLGLVGRKGVIKKYFNLGRETTPRSVG